MYRETNILKNLESFADSRPDASVSHALSLKLRPVATKDGHSDRCVYPGEYRELENEILHLSKARSHDYRADPVYEVDGSGVLLCHETGPELLLLVEAFLSQYPNIISGSALLLALTESLRRLVRRNCDTKDTSRHDHDVEFLRVELRAASRSGALEEVVVETFRIGEEIDPDVLEEKLDLALRTLGRR